MGPHGGQDAGKAPHQEAAQPNRTQGGQGAGTAAGRGEAVRVLVAALSLFLAAQFLVAAIGYSQGVKCKSEADQRVGGLALCTVKQWLGGNG